VDEVEGAGGVAEVGQGEGDFAAVLGAVTDHVDRDGPEPVLWQAGAGGAVQRKGAEWSGAIEQLVVGPEVTGIQALAGSGGLRRV
jgi:hypothetical protein